MCTWAPAGARPGGSAPTTWTEAGPADPLCLWELRPQPSLVAGSVPRRKPGHPEASLLLLTSSPRKAADTERRGLVAKAGHELVTQTEQEVRVQWAAEHLGVEKGKGRAASSVNAPPPTPWSFVFPTTSPAVGPQTPTTSASACPRPELQKIFQTVPQQQDCQTTWVRPRHTDTEKVRTGLFWV